MRNFCRNRRSGHEGGKSVEGCQILEAGDSQEFLRWCPVAEALPEPRRAHETGPNVEVGAGAQEKIRDLSRGRADAAGAKEPISGYEVPKDSPEGSVPLGAEGYDAWPALPDDYVDVIGCGVEVSDANSEDLSRRSNYAE